MGNLNQVMKIAQKDLAGLELNWVELDWVEPSLWFAELAVQALSYPALCGG